MPLDHHPSATRPTLALRCERPEQLRELLRAAVQGAEQAWRREHPGAARSGRAYAVADGVIELLKSLSCRLPADGPQSPERLEGGRPDARPEGVPVEQQRS